MTSLLDVHSEFTPIILPVYDSKDVVLGLDVKLNLDLYNLLVSKYLLQVLLADFKPNALCAELNESKGALLISLPFS